MSREAVPIMAQTVVKPGWRRTLGSVGPAWTP